MMRNIFYCVELVRMDLQEYHTRRYQTMVQYGIDAYGKLQLGTEKKVKVYYFTPNAAMQAVLPADYDFYTKIGANLGGRLFTLSLNKDMPLHRKLDPCGHDIAEVIANCGCYGNWWNYGFNWIPHYRNGQFVGEMYSAGGGSNSLGYFRIDQQYNLIQVQNVPRMELMMEYVGTGGDDGETMCPNMAVPAIRAWIHYQLVKFDRRQKDMIGERQDAYNLALKEYRDLELSFTLDEFMDAMYSTAHFKLP